MESEKEMFEYELIDICMIQNTKRRMKITDGVPVKKQLMRRPHQILFMMQTEFLLAIRRRKDKCVVIKYMSSFSNGENSISITLACLMKILKNSLELTKHSL